MVNKSRKSTIFLRYFITTERTKKTTVNIYELDEKREELMTAMNYLKQAIEALPDSCDSSAEDLRFVIDEVASMISDIDEKENAAADRFGDMYIDSYDADRAVL